MGGRRGREWSDYGGGALVWLLRRRLGDAEGAGSGAARVEAMEV